MKEGKIYRIIGCMSGTSLDGLDMAFCSFIKNKEKIIFRIEQAETLSYDREWKSRLMKASSLPGRELFRLDHEFGKFLGERILTFIKKHKLQPHFISSHGHTVFHEPSGGGSLQIGNGHNITAITQVPVICDFRNADIALGGQGAPLVPAGDEYLFPQYDYCLNLGGFSNISFKEKGERRAYDICPVNTVINDLAGKEGLEYDHNGDLARKGKPYPEMVHRLNSIDYYIKDYPKSLGREFLEKKFYPVLNEYNLPTADILASIYMHIAEMIASAIQKDTESSVLLTGGGAKNSYLTEKISEQTKADLVIPDDKIVDFKEALIFAFLGILKIEKQNNCFASVTGAREDSCGGILYGTFDG
ncbi:MAG: anhydro-N-acetylmuramic acid kinase [Bacteroidota bacterium]